MSADDDDMPTTVATSPPGHAADDGPTAEDVMEDEGVADFRQFAALAGRKQVTAQSIRKGEKDFESHGTRAQADAIEQSRQVMQDVLSYTRIHREGFNLRGWYFPDTWAKIVEVGEDEEAAVAEGVGAPAAPAGGTTRATRKRPIYTRDRVVVLDVAKGSIFSSLGTSALGVKKNESGYERLWLLPEEALFLLERGSLDIWWPLRPLEEIFPPQGIAPSIGIDEYDAGLPLSLQAAYSLLIGMEGERGKVPLRTYQAYSHLKRCGYHIMRPLPTHKPDTPASSTMTPLHQPMPIWQWLMSLVAPKTQVGRGAPPPYGPLVRPGLYRSYKAIFDQMNIIPRHKPSPEPSSTSEPEDPFRVHFHVWKAHPHFKKARPPPVDYFLAVVDANETSIPTLEEMTTLLESTRWEPPGEAQQGPGPARLHQRLKHGYRKVLVAVVDHGIVNFMQFSEGAFGEDPVSGQYDSNTGRGGGKGGGRGRGRGGNRGGRGRGRGRGR